MMDKSSTYHEGFNAGAKMAEEIAMERDAARANLVKAKCRIIELEAENARLTGDALPSVTVDTPEFREFFKNCGGNLIWIEDYFQKIIGHIHAWQHDVTTQAEQVAYERGIQAGAKMASLRASSKPTSQLTDAELANPEYMRAYVQEQADMIDELITQREGSAEPYGWAYECAQPGTDGKGWAEFLSRTEPKAAHGVRNIKALYTAPPAQPDSVRDAALMGVFDGEVPFPNDIPLDEQYVYLRGYRNAVQKFYAAMAEQQGEKGAAK